jgi:hypothetical protein
MTQTAGARARPAAHEPVSRRRLDAGVFPLSDTQLPFEIVEFAPQFRDLSFQVRDPV